MLSNVQYNFLRVNQPEKVVKEYKDLLLENAKHLIVTDEKLALEGTVLKYWSVINGAKSSESVKQESMLDLRDIWIPGAAGWQHPVPMLMLPDYAKAIVEITDIYANNAKHTPTFVKTGLKSQFTIAAQFVEYMCLHGYLSLQSIPQKQIDVMLDALRKGGIPAILQLHSRVNTFIDQLIETDELETFLIKAGDKPDSPVTSLRVTLLARHIGSVSLENQIPTSVYEKVANHLVTKGVHVSKHFASKGAPLPSQPAAKSLNNWFVSWNRFAKLDSNDQLKFIPFPSPHTLANKHGKTPDRTNNLELEEVISLLGSSHKWIFEYSKIVIKIVKEITSLKAQLLNDDLRHRTLTEIRFPEYLSKSLKINKLEKAIGIEIHKSSLTNSTSDKFSLTEICTLMISACYVILQTYNARRQAEIQSPLTGITEEHFRCVDRKHNWYQANFYNGKNGKRQWYTLNHGSVKAIQCLIAFKEAWDADNSAEGLFNVPSFTLNEEGRFNHYKYHFNKGKDSKITGNAFLKLILGKLPNTESHPFRRIYALIYHYQYKNADLLALCYQLGHIDPAHTMVYVTEPKAREVHEQLHHKVKLTKDELAESTIAIQEENKALDKVIEEVGVEVTAKDISALLMGSEEMAGKYPAYLKKVYKILQRSVTFNNLTNEKFGKDFKDLTVAEKSESIAKVLESRGHKHSPKAHGTCHKSDRELELSNSPCEPIKCSGCPYQEVKSTQLNVLKEDLVILKAKQSDFSLLPIERLRAKNDVSNLSFLIQHHERSMERSKTLFSDDEVKAK